MEIKTNEDIHANVKGIFNKYYCAVIFQIKSGLVITPEDFIGKLNEIKS